MRAIKLISVTLICMLLCACVTSLLVGNQVQRKMMGAFLKPLVGFDPNEVNLFETPMIKNRMVAILGDKYEPAMKLLRTANEIQKEGALFYVVSRYAPNEVRDVSDKAAMVWNADTNQMAVMLIQGGTPQIFSEQIERAKQTITPVLPKEVQDAYDKAVAAKNALEEKQKALQSIQHAIENPLEAAGEMAKQKIDAQVQKAEDAVSTQAQKVTQPIETVGNAAQQTIESKIQNTQDAAAQKVEQVTQPIQAVGQDAQQAIESQIQNTQDAATQKAEHIQAPIKDIETKAKEKAEASQEPIQQQ